MKKIIYNFKSNLTKKIANPKNILGGKGANLSEMGKLGFAVLQVLPYQQKHVNYFTKIRRNLI